MHMVYAPSQSSQPSSSERLLSAFKPMIWLFWYLLLLQACLYGVEVAFREDGHRFLNVAGPIGLALGCGLCSLFLVIKENKAIWTPVPWTLLAFAIFYGMGPLYPIFGGTGAMDRVSRTWVFREDVLWQTNIMNMFAVSSMVFGFCLFASLFKRRDMATAQQSEQFLQRQIPIAKVAVFFFLLLGLPVKYLLVLPVRFGVSQIVVPGVLGSFLWFILVAVVFLGFLSHRLGGGWSVTFYALCGAELLVGLLLLNKSELLYVPIMAVLGRFLSHRNISFVVRMGFGIFLLYLAIKPVVKEGRRVLDTRGTRSHAGFQERSSAVQEAYTNLGSSVSDSDDDVEWWARFCYVPPHAFVIDQYDSGLPGRSFDAVWYVLIPRVLWPEKPTFVEGREFTFLFVGHRSSFTGIGLVGEAYWNGGWLSIFLTFFYVGFVFSLLSISSMWIVSRFEWFFLPLVMFGIIMGLGVNGWFVPLFVGSFGQYASFAVFLYVSKFIYEQFRGSLT